MAVTVSAATVGVGTPPVVQVVIDGLSIGAAVEVTGRSGASSWVVRGGTQTAASSQLIVLDELPALNADTSYEVRVGGVLVATSTPVSVPWSPLGHLLQSVDGAVQVPVLWHDNRDPRALAVAQHLSRVPGRRAPVLRFAAAGGRSGLWVVRTQSSEDSRTLEQLIAVGAPVVLRRADVLADLDATQIATIETAESVLIGPLPWRRWSLSWVELDDPLAGMSASGDTWLDVDNAYAGTTFADLDAAYAGTTFGDWNRTDWEGLGA